MTQDETQQGFSIELSPLWSLISQVKDKVNGLMQGYSQGQIDFAVMVMSELMENAIKYGVSHTELPYVGITFVLDEGIVTITISNGIYDEEQIQDFLKIMDKIIASENKEELYIMRMQEILEHPEVGGSQLGLYRITSEAMYDLSYTIENKILTINATKKMEG
ncbi:MAG: hypothetical protein AAF518_20545 [Spirochaetota bacterium]